MTPKGSPKSPNLLPKMMPTWLYRQDFAKFSLNRHYNYLIHLGQDKALAYYNVLPLVLSVVISVSAPQRHSSFLGRCKDHHSWSEASGRVLCGVSDSITILCRLCGSHVWLLLRRIESSSSRKPCRFFPLPDDVFPLSVPAVSRYTLQAPREHLVAGLTEDLQAEIKVTSEGHLGWGIAGGLVNGTPVGKQEKGLCPSPVDFWIPGERDCSGWFD
ncbi:hypothetical protein TNCV_4298721 [Trichonephila clavipes]|nr:hypothetical protein TNCV_4298721 [Trichonephila clavipes]